MRTSLTTTQGNTTVTADDSPSLILSDGAGPYTDVTPPPGGFTEIHVVYHFIIYAVWQFADGSVYYLGYNAEPDGWSVHFQGMLTPRAGGGYDFMPFGHNGNYGTTGPFTVNNDVPPQAEPPVANPPAWGQGSKPDWR